MKPKRLSIQILLVFCALIVVSSGCSNDSNRNINLSELLINQEDMPPGWSISEFSNVGVEPYRSRDSVSIGFYSDLYPTQFNSMQSVYRFSSMTSARRDYNDELEFYKRYNYVPSQWSFISNAASESYVSCSDNSFQHCVWIARYNSIVIEFRAALIPERLSLDDMENIVRKIDLQARELIINAR